MVIVILIVNLNFVVDDNLDYVIDFYKKKKSIQLKPIHSKINKVQPKRDIPFVHLCRLVV